MRHNGRIGSLRSPAPCSIKLSHRYAAQNQAYQHGLTRYPGLGKNRTQVGARGIFANVELIGGFLEREAIRQE